MSAPAPAPLSKPLTEYDFARTGPDTLAGRYMRQFWHPVAISAALSPGKAKKIRIMNEDYTLYRGESGKPQILQNRCPHRGTQLSLGWVQGDDIRCLYHGWKFGRNGQCVEMPYETPDSVGKVRIGSYPTGEFLDMIWGYFGEGEAPPFPPFPAFEGGGFIEIREDILLYNYFQTHENDFDPYHVAWTHSRNDPHDYFKNAFVVGDQPAIEETEWGILERMNLKIEPADPVILALPPCAARTIFPTPNAVYDSSVCPPNRDAYLIHVPIDDESQMQYLVQQVLVKEGQEARYAELSAAYEAASIAKPGHVVGQAILEGRIEFDDAIKDFPCQPVVEDFAAQGGQGKIADRKAERLGRSDANIVRMRRIWAREFDKIAKGAPTKTWTTLTECPRELTEMKEAYRKLGLC